MGQSPQWRSISAVCRELGWSKPRLLHELRAGLPYRTFPPGHIIDWGHLNIEQTLDMQVGTVTIYTMADADGVFGFNAAVLGIEVDVPTLGTEVAATPPLSAPKSLQQWLADKTRDLLAQRRIPAGITELGLARLLKKEMDKAGADEVESKELGTIRNQLKSLDSYPIDDRQNDSKIIERHGQAAARRLTMCSMALSAR